VWVWAQCRLIVVMVAAVEVFSVVVFEVDVVMVVMVVMVGVVGVVAVLVATPMQRTSTWRRGALCSTKPRKIGDACKTNSEGMWWERVGQIWLERRVWGAG
jgi:hypothetical protein